MATTRTARWTSWEKHTRSWNALRERGHRAAVEPVINPPFDDLGAQASDRGGVRPARPVAGHPLPAPSGHRCTGQPAPPAGAAERAHRSRTGPGAGGADQLDRFVDKSRRAGLGDAARRGHLPVLDVDACTGSCAPTAQPGTPPPGAPTRARASPELLATARSRCGPGTSPSCADPQRGVYYDLYVILDIFSRYVVGWTVAAREDAASSPRSASSRRWPCTGSARRCSTPTGAPR